MILLKKFIPVDRFIKSGFDQNITKATELYTYLIDERKAVLYPIQELFMG